MTIEFERRSIKPRIIAEGRELTGLAAAYDVETELPQGFIESIAPGAFRSVLDSQPDVVLLFNHDPSQLLGRTSAGTLQLAEDHKGLNFRCQLPDTELGRSVHKAVERRDLTGCSFAFKVGKGDDQWSEKRGKPYRRIIGFSQLQDVSVVTFPAYTKGTSVDVRADHTVVPVEVRSAAQQVMAEYRQSQNAAFKQTAEFVREQLAVPLFWDSKANERPFEDQMKLIRMALDLEEMRTQGWNVEVRRDANNWPRIVHVGPTAQERAAIRRRSRLMDFLLQ